MKDGTHLTVSTATNSNAAIISSANGVLTINIPTTSEVEGIVVITAEVGLAILTALVPFVGLPAWLIILLPILKADIPLAEMLFSVLAGNAQKLQKQGANPKTVLQTLQDQLGGPDNNPDAPWAISRDK